MNSNAFSGIAVFNCKMGLFLCMFFLFAFNVLDQKQKSPKIKRKKHNV